MKYEIVMGSTNVLQQVMVIHLQYSFCHRDQVSYHF